MSAALHLFKPGALQRWITTFRLPMHRIEEITEAQENVCDYLAMDDESILTDVVRGRTTQMIILASGLAIYGGLLEPVQYMASNPMLETILEEQNLASTGGSFRLVGPGPARPPSEVANEVEQWLEED